MLEVACQPVRLELGGNVFCPSRGAAVDPLRWLCFADPPDVLVIQLTRFGQEGARMVTYCAPVVCPRRALHPPAQALA